MLGRQNTIYGLNHEGIYPQLWAKPAYSAPTLTLRSSLVVIRENGPSGGRYKTPNLSSTNERTTPYFTNSNNEALLSSKMFQSWQPDGR